MTITTYVELEKFANNNPSQKEAIAVIEKISIWSALWNLPGVVEANLKRGMPLKYALQNGSENFYYEDGEWRVKSEFHPRGFMVCEDIVTSRGPLVTMKGGHKDIALS